MFAPLAFESSLAEVPDQQLAGWTWPRSPTVLWSRGAAITGVRITDAGAVLLGAGVAWTACSRGSAPISAASVLLMSIIAGVVTVSGLERGGLYRANQLHDLPVEPPRVFGALLIGCLAAIGLVLPDAPKSPDVWLWAAPWFLSSFAFLLGARHLSRQVLARVVATGRIEQRVAVVGSDGVNRQVQDRLGAFGPAVRLAEFHGDRLRRAADDRGLAALCDRLDDMMEAIGEDRVDHILLALLSASDTRIALVRGQLEELGARVHIVSDAARAYDDWLESLKIRKDGPGTSCSVPAGRPARRALRLGVAGPARAALLAFASSSARRLHRAALPLGGAARWRPSPRDWCRSWLPSLPDCSSPKGMRPASLSLLSERRALYLGWPAGAPASTRSAALPAPSPRRAERRGRRAAAQAGPGPAACAAQA